ncbi:TIGR02679 family protein [Nonomuraea angiospora]|uniref:TIGR02679 family protein n=1 Tax=Nonomuraea angiospora TaxID=46172 RepID=UPI00344B8F98
MTTHLDAVARYREVEFRRLFTAARRSLERTGWDLSGTIGITNPNEAERNAIVGITGRYHRSGIKRIEITLSKLDAAVRTATGLSLTEFLEQIGPKLANRPAEAAKDATSREEALRPAYQSSLYETADWYRTWLNELSRDGTLTKLLAQRETMHIVAQATRVLEFMENRPKSSAPITLPALAAAVTHNTKALNHGISLSTLVVRALATRAGIPKPTTAEERRDLWDRFDVILDDLASRVLVLNLPADGTGLGEWLTGAARFGTPFYVTLHQIINHPITIAAPVVYVCENPAVLRRAAGELGPKALPLVCTEGRPSTAFHRLARTIAADGGELRYHGDFDWPGIAIATNVFERHEARPWRMSAADYLGGLATGDDHVKLVGRQIPSPWDPRLSQAMCEHSKAVYEEAVADPLLADLQGPAICTR